MIAQVNEQCIEDVHEIPGSSYGYVLIILAEADKWSTANNTGERCRAIKILATNDYITTLQSEKYAKYEFTSLLIYSIKNPFVWARYLNTELKKRFKKGSFDPAFIELGVESCFTGSNAILLNIMHFAMEFLYPIHKRI